MVIFLRIVLAAFAVLFCCWATPASASAQAVVGLAEPQTSVGRDGSAVTVWTEQTSPTGKPRVMAAYRKPRASRFGRKRMLTRGPAASQVALARRGERLLAVWQRGGQLECRSSMNGGRSWDRAVTVADADLFVGQISAALSPSGAALVSWWQLQWAADGTVEQLTYQYAFAPAGRSFNDAVQLERRSAAAEPELEMNAFISSRFLADGDAQVSWHTDQTGRTQRTVQLDGQGLPAAAG